MSTLGLTSCDNTTSANKNIFASARIDAAPVVIKAKSGNGLLLCISSSLCVGIKYSSYPGDVILVVAITIRDNYYLLVQQQAGQQQVVQPILQVY